MNSRQKDLVTLRAMEPEDLDMLYRVENDRDLWFVGVTNVPYSRYILHNYIATATGDIYTDKQVRLIVENGEGEAVGMADLTNFDPRHRRAELSLVIEKPWRRHGYARAAVLEMHRYAQTVLHLHQLYVVISEQNENTLTLFQSLGYTTAAHLEDWLYDGDKYTRAVLMQKILLNKHN